MSKTVGVKDILFVLVFSTVVFFGAFFLFSSLKETEVKRKVSIRSLEKNLNSRVNKKIQRLQTRDSIFKSKLETDSFDARAAGALDENFKDQNSKYDLETFEFKNTESLQLTDSQNVSDRLRALLDSQDSSASEKARLIEQYKEELIERAREQGWAITIDDNLEVTSAKRL
jgi:hypothetical protein